MSVKKNAVWRYVIECAITGSIDYSLATPKIAFCDEKVLEKCLVQFISQKESCTQEVARKIYRDCVVKALNQEKPGEKYVNLARIGSAIGVVALVVLLSGVVASLFSLVHLGFALLALSFSRGCNEYIRVAELKKKATAIWKDMLQESSEKNVCRAVEQMEQIFLQKK
jgi:ribosomal protein L18E